MRLPKIILAPTDLSPHAEKALDYAISLAAKLDATVHLLTVIGVPAFGVPELGAALSASAVDNLVRDNQAALDRLAAARRGQCKLGDTMLRTGDARDVILHTAEEIHADLIVIATHGRRGLSRALLGSVAESIIRSSPVPVLTVRTPKGG